jgi:serine/threonine protein kinase
MLRLESALLLDVLDDRGCVVEVGRGGFGAVTRATYGGQAVVVKSLLRDTDLLGLIREATSMLVLNGAPYTLVLRGVCRRQDGRVVLVAPYAAGGSVSVRLRMQPPPSHDEVLRWIMHVATALDHAHQVGLLHRDVKAQNVLLDADGKALLADFGLARLTRTDPDRALPGAGTPTHLEPEQWCDQEPCDKSDVYSFGVFVWEVVTRQRPWRGLDARGIRDALARGERLPIPADAPLPLGDVMRQCFAPRDQRPRMQGVLAIFNAAPAPAARIERANGVVPGNMSAAAAPADGHEHPADATVADNAEHSVELGCVRFLEVENASNDGQPPHRRQRVSSSVDEPSVESVALGLHSLDMSAESVAQQPPQQHRRFNPSNDANLVNGESARHPDAGMHRPPRVGPSVDVVSADSVALGLHSLEMSTDSVAHQPPQQRRGIEPSNDANLASDQSSPHSDAGGDRVHPPPSGEDCRDDLL